ncbi:type II secretion system F family protein [Sedimentibacter sp. MB31-C6]|uniref:type II secretion system F family protein n=1 Tax=Sedimentibacter sp. MB31-C6 TaxID=3109366 RepID=UPI002DDD7E53|nr:type II secretion system F family protein [Sedimentibacter sp. MB36-C1]WSI04920.1 type II secretion system F family protein [Sedimentibacter sp. MB36-C1]
MNKTYSKKLSSSELSFFCMQVALTLKSGMLIYDGISWMHDDIEEGKIKKVLGIIKQELSKGVPLYQAMNNSNFFPPYVVNMSQIGNATGKLENVMTSLSKYYDREEFIKLKIKNSIFYPSMLFVMMTLVIILLVTKIFPVFESMISELGGELSNEASILMSFSTGILAGKLIMYILIIFLIIIVAFLGFGKTIKGKELYNSFLNKNIITKVIMKNLTAYRFSSSLSLLLSSGLNIDNSLDLLLQILENSHLKNKIKVFQKCIKSGEPFIESLSKLSLFSSMHLQMINMGYKTGELDTVMDKLTTILENEVEQRITNNVALIEPILVGFLSIAIGVILISVMLPLMNIMASIG